jgi:hypothetical protein
MAFQQSDVKQEKKQPEKTQKPQPTAKTETFWQKALRITGISATPAAMKGDEETLVGDLWIVDLNTRASRRITRSGGYRSPIFLAGEMKALAIKGDDVVEIPVDGGEVKKLYTIKGFVKLVGLNADDHDQVLVLSEDGEGRPSVELLSLKDGRRTALTFSPDSDEDSKMLAHIRGWERVYNDGGITLYTKTETRDGLAGSTIEWSDVYLKKEKLEPVNISKCDGMNCGQPSLSLNARYVLYVKSDE